MEMCFLVIENMFCAVFVFLCTGLSKHRWEREIPNTVAGEREKERQANHTLGFGLRKSRGRERERECVLWVFFKKQDVRACGFSFRSTAKGPEVEHKFFSESLELVW